MRVIGISFLLVFLISSLAFSATTFAPFFRDDQYLADSLLHLSAADLNGDGRDEIWIIGRDYIDPQVILYGVEPGADKPVTIWQSPNMMEQNSPVLLATGKFLDHKTPQAAVFTNHRLYIYGWSAEAGYHQMLNISHDIGPWEISAVDWNQDGLDEFVVSRAVKNDSTPIKRIEIYQLLNGGLNRLSVGPSLGNIRSLAAGDLNGDGVGEIVAEVGKTRQAGNYYLYTAGQTSWAPVLGPVTLVKAPVYGMTVAPFNGRPALFTAGERGKASVFQWNDGKLEPKGEFSFSAGLVAIASGTFWPGRSGIAVLAYPKTFHLLQEGDEQ